MSDLAIHLAGGRTAYEPGGTLRGSVHWRYERAPLRLQLNLLWRAAGSGEVQIAIVDVAQITGLAAVGERPFQLKLPRSPWSYEGTILRIEWGLELVDSAAEIAARVELVIAPGGEAMTSERFAGG